MKKGALRRGSLVILAVLLILPFVYAYDTQITVSTFANHDLDLKIIDPSQQNNENGGLLQQFKNNTGSTGRMSFTHSSGVGRIDIVIIVRKDGKIVEINGEKIHKYEGHSAGTALDVDLTPKTEVPVVATPTPVVTENNTALENETSSEENLTQVVSDISEPAPETEQVTQTQEVAAPETASSPGVTGNAILEKFKKSSLLYVAIFAAVVAVLVLFLAIGRNVLKSRNPKEIKVTKFSDLKAKQEEEEQGIELASEEVSNNEEGDQDLSRAEMKLRQAQSEFEKLRKIKDIEKRIDQSRRELEDLRK